MNWRAFQAGFIFGVMIAAYSQHAGATGFKTMADLAAAGVVFGVLVDAFWGVQVALWRQRSRAAGQ